MNEHRIGKHSAVGRSRSAEPEAPARTPGKHTLVESVYGQPSPAGSMRTIQRRLAPAGAEPPAAEQVQAAAARGVSGAGGRLPYLDVIQAAFGRHDISHVQAHTDEAAGQGAAAMGAQAYATGSRIAFGRAPDLHTAAHEAAHVVQQRAGVHLKAGVGEAGDAHERHADAVADRVARGESAEALLDAYASAVGSGEAAVQRQLVKVDTDQGTKYYDSRSGDEFKRVVGGVYVNHNGDAFWYDSTTHQYQTMFHTMWDPVTKKIFDMPVFGRYREQTTGRYYQYVNDHYIIEPMPNTQYGQSMSQPPTPSTESYGNWQPSQMGSPSTHDYSTHDYSTHGYSTQDSMSMYSQQHNEYSGWGQQQNTLSMEQEHTTTQTTRQPAPKNDDPMQAKTWLSTEYSYVTLDAKGKKLALSILEGLVSSNKEMAWTFLENWNAVCGGFVIFPDEVGLKESSKQQEVEKERKHLSEMRVFTRNVVQGRDYRGRPSRPGASVSLPTDHELTINLDLYWRGKDDEMGGSATLRKLEKHGENSNSELGFAKTAFAFARANHTRWFYQAPNQIVFHNYVPGQGGQIKMAVWDYLCGAMVTFYTVEPSRVGDVDEYMRGKGFVS